MQPGDVAETYADINDLVSNFDYQPSTNIQSGIKKFVTWYKAYYGYKQSMRVLIFGSSGQLGQALRSTAIRDTEVTYASHSDCDISNQRLVAQFMDAVEPDFVINCAAYTAVDRAEEEVEHCYRINALAPQIVAKCCSLSLIHI